MKKLILIALVVLTTNSLAFAKGGNDSEFDRTQAGFIEESLEHVLEQVYFSNPVSANEVKNAAVVSASETESAVTLTLQDGSAITYICFKFQETSRSRTVVKTEVACKKQ